LGTVETKTTRLALHVRILIGLAAGAVAGALVNVLWTDAVWLSLGVGEPTAFMAGEESARNAEAGMAVYGARFVAHLNGFAGDLFIRLLRFIAVPIVLFSLIEGASSLNDLRKLSRIGGKTVAVYIATTALAISIGLAFANLLQPGRAIPDALRDRLASAGSASAAESIARAEAPSAWTTLLHIVPANPFAALAEGNMLQVVFFALAVGVALTLVKAEKAQVVITAASAMSDVIIKLVHVIMLAAPYAVFALIAKVVAQLGLDVLAALSAYGLVVLAGLATMVFGVYPAVLKLFSRVGFRRFFVAIAPAQLLAFSSSSSSATLPVTLECATERLGVGEEVASFALPLGATINMDGTALYQGVATLFIAQLYGIDLGLGQQLTIVLTATLASIGTAGVPGVGLVMLVIVLQAVGMPQHAMAGGIAIIFGIDRLLDMCRTACNVTGDCMVAASVAASEGALRSEREVAERLARMSKAGLDEHPTE
jgi:proton glutamate symport protein